jgi:hypothetical protein
MISGKGLFLCRLAILVVVVVVSMIEDGGCIDLVECKLFK